MSSILTQPNLRNIIFDLGDVIIPIDLSAPIRNFAMLANLSEEEVTTLWQEHNQIMAYETGLIDDQAFRQHVRDLLKQRGVASDDWADEVIDTAWNTILLDLPVERVKRIQQLQGKYRLFLLSNTSPIHIQRVNQILTDLDLPVLDDLFERVFYSYEVRLAKPAPEIYTYVLQEAGLEADETAFLDDNYANIQGALSVGIHATHVQKPLTILDYLA
ncbi:HAD family hydrolase [Arsenicibacter rosenii]|uniref:Haloacid dehalogenase n=1 Tax=Arsenicibacter rosenii TaxID=1750698 RepID=A0A1S2VPG7_9BACT|nr:HAD family phosphatase [Arsenicibacter rosenii]OIN59688.1 haloacid dehalogenase [Arsenicibacter rosenii]